MDPIAKKPEWLGEPFTFGQEHPVLLFRHIFKWIELVIILDLCVANYNMIIYICYEIAFDFCSLFLMKI